MHQKSVCPHCGHEALISATKTMADDGRAFIESCCHVCERKWRVDGLPNDAPAPFMGLSVKPDRRIRRLPPPNGLDRRKQ
jgi:hypothetical protein